jgi:transcription antitermination protein NusB
MQVLYAMNRDRDLTHRHAMLLYKDSIRHSFDLYLLNLLQIMRVAEYAQQDYANKSSKLRPTPEDKAFRPKLCQNPLIKSLQENRGLTTLFKTQNIVDRVKEDNTRLLYQEFAKTEQYEKYLGNREDKAESHRQALLDLYKCCITGELFNDVMDENYLTWTDDKSLVVGAMKKTIKALPTDGVFYQEFEPDDETVREFGETLLQAVEDYSEELMTIIEPNLKNWDAERVAVIDMILLKMAVCELMNFPTIPTKVTLNEYVEISKLYSTDKSKDFINGILDRLMKQLEKDGKIVKEGRGLIDE